MLHLHFTKHKEIKVYYLPNHHCFVLLQTLTDSFLNFWKRNVPTPKLTPGEIEFSSACLFEGLEKLTTITSLILCIQALIISVLILSFLRSFTSLLKYVTKVLTLQGLSMSFADFYITLIDLNFKIIMLLKTCLSTSIV